MAIPVYQITVKDYACTAKVKPDWAAIGARIDKKIKEHFLGKRAAIRCISSHEHKGKSVNDIVKIIRRLGTDRYDPHRKGDRYENIGDKKIDFFAIDFTIRPKSVIMEKFIEPFYTWPRQSGNKPVRLDVAIIYDLSKLKRVVHQYEGRSGIKKDGFVFKNPNKKKDALLGIIKIL